MLEVRKDICNLCDLQFLYILLFKNIAFKVLAFS